MGHLSLCRLRIDVRPIESCTLPPYLGSTLRGALASSLRHIVCLFRDQECGECRVRERCAYSTLFETPPRSGIPVWQSIRSWPRPIVIEPPEEGREHWSTDDTLAFRILLFGHAAETFPYLTLAIERMLEHGLGRGRHPFRLVRIVDDVPDSDDPVLYEPGVSGERLHHPNPFTPVTASPAGKPDATHVTIDLKTPTRIKYHGGLIQNLTAPALVQAILGRITSLVSFHCLHEPIRLDIRPWMDLASKVESRETALQLAPLARWSNRQQTSIRQDGLVGTVDFEGPGLSQLLPLLRLGMVTHVGKGTVFGLGRYDLSC